MLRFLNASVVHRGTLKVLYHHFLMPSTVSSRLIKRYYLLYNKIFIYHYKLLLILSYLVLQLRRKMLGHTMVPSPSLSQKWSVLSVCTPEVCSMSADVLTNMEFHSGNSKSDDNQRPSHHSPGLLRNKASK